MLCGGTARVYAVNNKKHTNILYGKISNLFIITAGDTYSRNSLVKC